MKRIIFIAALSLLTLSSVSHAAYSSQYGDRGSSGYSVNQNHVKAEGSYTNGLNGPFFVSYQELVDVSNKMQEKLGIPDFQARSNTNTSPVESVRPENVVSATSSPQSFDSNNFSPAAQKVTRSPQNRSFAQVAEGFTGTPYPNKSFNTFAQTD